MDEFSEMLSTYNWSHIQMIFQSSDLQKQKCLLAHLRTQQAQLS